MPEYSNFFELAMSETVSETGLDESEPAVRAAPSLP